MKLESWTNRVYIDGSGSLRRPTNTISEKLGPVTVIIEGEADYSNYGVVIAISPPPADQVGTFEQLLATAG